MLMCYIDVNKFAALLATNGISKGEFIAVFMTNSPEMVITILALSKLSAVSGLINTNLRGTSSPPFSRSSQSNKKTR